jgi:hypothetical protein
MSVWPQQLLSPARRDHEPRPFGRHKQPHCTPLWLLLAGIVVIGIGIGLFATSITAILLSSSGAQAADPAGGCSCHTGRWGRVWWALRDIHQGGRDNDF